MVFLLLCYLPCQLCTLSLIPARNLHTFWQRGRTLSSRKEMVSASDEDAIADLIEPHEQFLNAAQSRLTKLQVIRML